jgi:glycosyltransferase involved in cell wall biosynthesis
LKILIVAPHCSIPPRNGAEKHAHELYETLDNGSCRVVFLGRQILLEGSRSEVFSSHQTWRDNKWIAGLVALMSGRDYLSVRHLGPKYVARFKMLVEKFSPDVILFHYVFSADLLRFINKSVKVVIETHNNDWNMYGNYSSKTKNPFIKIVCRKCITTYESILDKIPVPSALLHVSDADRLAFKSRYSKFDHWLIENGVHLKNITSVANYNQPTKQIVFVGSLSSRMNVDALVYFERHMWSVLKRRVVFTVAGAKPANSIKLLCSRNGWILRPNVSEMELCEIYIKSHFLVMPFEYGQGSKNKLLEALSYKVPVVSTQAGVCGFATIPPMVSVSDNPDDWLSFICNRKSISEVEKQSVDQFLSQFTWERQARRFLEKIESLDPISNFEKNW